MLGPSLSIRRSSMMALALICPGLAIADGPPTKSEARKAADAVRPSPTWSIPDDPPPHEGAMIDIPYTIEPPDILVVEFLEALPGRPITGERLVRPDGTISLGFYGEVQVRGLTTRQAKVKLIHHLRQYLNDESLGLIEPEPGSGPIKALPEPGTILPHQANPPASRPNPVSPGPGAKPEPEAETPLIPARSSSPSGSPTPRGDRGPRRIDRRSAQAKAARRGAARKARFAIQEPSTTVKPDPTEAPPGEKAEGPEAGVKHVVIGPSESLRVFVNVTAYNSKIYYVQGDVAVPGRLPFTGKETVLDALNFAGGFVASAETRDIHLYRPARGGKPARDYPIDLEAIYKGDTRANLQVLPDDRLVVGRNPIVKKTAQLDRIAAPILNVMGLVLQYSLANRSLTSVGLPLSGNAEIRAGAASGSAPAAEGGTVPAPRSDEGMKEWVDFLWDLSERQAAGPLDGPALREALLKKLSPTPAIDPKK